MPKIPKCPLYSAWIKLVEWDNKQPSAQHHFLTSPFLPAKSREKSLLAFSHFCIWTCLKICYIVLNQLVNHQYHCISQWPHEVYLGYTPFKIIFRLTHWWIWVGQSYIIYLPLSPIIPMNIPLKPQLSRLIHGVVCIHKKKW